MKHFLVEEAVVEDEFSNYNETYYVGEWREREDVPSAEQDFKVATRWYVDDNYIWIVRTTDGKFRAATEKEETECSEYQAPLGNVRHYL